MPILTPPPSKPQRGIRATFAALMDGFIAWLVDTFYPEMVALVAAISALVSGGANKVPYKVDLGTAMADPGAGWLRLNSAAQNAATAMVVDVIGSDTLDYTSLLNTFSGSTSIVLGQIRVEKMGDASKFLVFNLLGMTTPAGYRQFTLACIGYSSATPFAQADPVVLSFTRTGDKGQQGISGYGFANMVVLSSTATWQPPAGVTKAEVTVIDGGDSGAVSSTQASTGGKGANASISIITVDPSVTYTGTVGAGGIAGAAGTTTSSQAGGASSFSGSGITTLTSANGTLKIPGGFGLSGSAGSLGGGSLYAPPVAGAAPTAYGGAGPGTPAGNAGYNGKSGAIILRY